MITFERTERKGEHVHDDYDGIRLEVSGGYDTPLPDYIHYFITFLEALTFSRDSIIEALKDYAEEENGYNDLPE